MRVAVVGAGAVGCYYGGMLARGVGPGGADRQRHDVILIGRPAHIEAMQADGLRLETASFDEYVAVEASVDPAAVAGAEVVLVAVKSADTEPVARQIGPYLRKGALVLSLQNGVDNADRLARLLPAHRVEPVVVYVATEMVGPGHVRHNGRGELVVGPGAASIEPEFAAAGVPVTVTASTAAVRAALWAKLAANCAWNAMSAIADRPYGWLSEVAGVTGVPGVLSDVVAECRAVAAAEGIDLPAELLKQVASLAQSMPGQRSSTAQDLARGRVTEIAHLNGYVVGRGADLGVPTPANRVLLTLVTALERRSAEMSGEVGSS